eukprot:5417361-Pyramimonas_sp.AAC.2
MSDATRYENGADRGAGGDRHTKEAPTLHATGKGTGMETLPGRTAGTSVGQLANQKDGGNVSIGETGGKHRI